MSNIEFSEKDFKLLLENYLKSLNPDVNIEVEFSIINSYVGLYEFCDKKCVVKVNMIKNIDINGYKVKQKINKKLSEEELKNILGNILGEEVICIEFNICRGGFYEDYDIISNITTIVNGQKLSLKM